MRNWLTSALWIGSAFAASPAFAASVNLTVPSPAIGTIQIVGSAKGNITRLTISIDGTIIKSCNARQCVAVWNTSAFANGSHRVRAQATLRDDRPISTEREVLVANDVPAPVPPAQPDIAPSSFTLGTATLEAGAATLAQIVVHNLGTAMARSVAVTLSLGTPSSTSQIGTIALGDLAAGAAGTLTTTVTAPLASGTYTVVATVATPDPEASMANNTTAATLAVATAPVTIPPPPSASTGCDYYAAPSATGNGTSPSMPFRVTDFWAVAAPGTTLCLLDGVYRGSASMIDPPDNVSGMLGAPITIRALNDGRVLIDGEGARVPVRLQYNDHFVLDGFNANRSSDSVILIMRSRHNVVRRVAAWDAADGNTSIFGTHYSEYILFEDVAGWGIARKIFSASQGGNYVTCRRCWGSWDGSHFLGPKMTYTLAYNNYNMLIENSLGTWSGRDMKQSYYLQCSSPTASTKCNQLFTNYTVDQPYGIFAMDRLDYDKNARSKILGSLAYVTGTDRFHAPSLFFVTNMDSVGIRDSTAFIQPGYHTGKRPFSLYGLRDATASSLTAHALTGIGGSNSIIETEWNTAEVALASTLLGGSSLFSGAGGAQMCTRYHDGVLTSTPLWPWPMNQRIIEARIQSGRPAVDVTATAESMLGPIPDRCKQ